MNTFKRNENIQAIQENRLLFLEGIQVFLRWYKKTGNSEWLSIAKEFGQHSKTADEIIKKLQYGKIH